MAYAECKRIADEYRETLHRIKRERIDLDQAPPHIQEALLRLHQNALLVWGVEHNRFNRARPLLFPEGQE